MNEETFYNYTDQLVLEAHEDHRNFIARLGACAGEDALIDELQIEIAKRNSPEKINWARVFVLAVFGEKHDLDQ